MNLVPKPKLPLVVLWNTPVVRKYEDVVIEIKEL